MNATYRAFAEFAQTWGLAYFVGLFVIVLVYALWPSRQRLFDEAARMLRHAIDPGFFDQRAGDLCRYVARPSLLDVERNHSRGRAVLAA